LTIGAGYLLSHTSGIPDYFADKQFIELVLREPGRGWTPLETIQRAKEHAEPGFRPGDGYRYCDTEYQLLGLIIDRVTGKSFHEALDERIFKPLGMDRSYVLHYSEPAHGHSAPLAPVYFKDTEGSSLRSMSFAWADGGIVSTSEELLRFIRALNEGKLVGQETFVRMQEWRKESMGMYYGCGLMQFRFKELLFALPDMNVIGHSGSIGSYRYYNPDYDVYITGTFNQSGYERKHMRFIIEVLTRAAEYADKE